MKPRDKRDVIRSNVAKGMIEAGTGIGKVMRDRRMRRPKDARRSWKREYHEEQLS